MKKCPKCYKTFDDSWKVCLYCSKELVVAESVLNKAPSAETVENKKPIGIVIFGWLIIIGAILSMLSIPQTSKVNPHFSTYLYYIIDPLMIISGIFLLRLKEWARVAIIVMLTLVVVESLLGAPHIVKKLPGYLSKQMIETEQSFDAKMKKEDRVISDEAKAKMDAMRAHSRPVAIVVGCAAAYISVALSILFCLGTIYYFTKTRIKERFG